MIARHSSSIEEATAAPPEAAVGLKRLLVHMATLAEQDAQRVPEHPETAVHAIRKRMKKLLALVRLARPAMTSEQFATLKGAIRQLKKLVASQRDEQVMAKLAQKLAEDLPHNLRRKGTPHRRRKVLKVVQVTPATVEQLAHLTSSLTDRLGRLRLFSLSWEMVADAYVKTYRKGHKAFTRVGENPAPEILHTWRKSVKDHYYQTLALYLWLGHPRRLRRTRRLSSLLGRIHDLDVFAETQKIDEPTQQILEERREKLLSKICQKGARVYAKNSSQMGELVKKRLPTGD